MKRWWVVGLCMVLLVSMVSIGHPANFYWKSTYADLNGIAGKADGDRGLVISSAGVMTFYYHTGGNWVEASYSATTPLMAGMKNNSDANGMSQAEMTTAGMYGTMFVATGAGTWNLPAAADGMFFCLIVPTAAAVIINPDDADVLVYDGLADTAGHQIAGGAADGDYICYDAIGVTNWHSMGRRGIWTPGG